MSVKSLGIDEKLDIISDSFAKVKWVQRELEKISNEFRPDREVREIFSLLEPFRYERKIIPTQVDIGKDDYGRDQKFWISVGSKITKIDSNHWGLGSLGPENGSGIRGNELEYLPYSRYWYTNVLKLPRPVLKQLMRLIPSTSKREDYVKLLVASNKLVNPEQVGDVEHNGIKYSSRTLYHDGKPYWINSLDSLEGMKFIISHYDDITKLIKIGMQKKNLNEHKNRYIVSRMNEVVGKYRLRNEILESKGAR